MCVGIFLSYIDGLTNLVEHEHSTSALQTGSDEKMKNAFESCQ